MSEQADGVWMVRVIPPPDRSGYRFAPYWEADTPLPDPEDADDGDPRA